MKKQTSEKQDSRSVKNQSNRPYGCPCGKYYLSYPALFTHVKQKHGGKAPGDLIKPESGKIRGRPKTKHPIQQNTEQDLTKIIQAVSQLVEQVQIDYSDHFQKMQGSQSCIQIATLFLSQFQHLQEQKYSILQCFLNELRENIVEKQNQSYWRDSSPQNLIQIANLMFINHENIYQKYPLQEDLLKQLIFYFFEWLYFKKFTDHRLQRRNQTETSV